ncbi:hypothetical protein NQZ68_028898 [Dissostichus eleginoides]|nr:hypothetical protein NQZ68_028898 [Dissostichus eleginoides]
MGKEQDLLQAAKSGDLLSTQKLLSKLKANRNNESFDLLLSLSPRCSMETEKRAPGPAGGRLLSHGPRPA